MFSISLVSAFYYGYLLIAVFSLKHIFKANYIPAPILHDKRLFVYAYLFVYKNFMVPDTNPDSFSVVEDNRRQFTRQALMNTAVDKRCTSAIA